MGNDEGGVTEAPEVPEEAREDNNVDGKNVDSSSSSSSSFKTESDSMDVVMDAADVADEGTSSSSPYVTVSDLLCTACRKLLFRPVVVNCGHGGSRAPDINKLSCLSALEAFCRTLLISRGLK